MKVRLIRQTRVTVKPGEIVEVSPEAAAFLVSTRCAVPVSEAKGTPAAQEKQATGKKKG